MSLRSLSSSLWLVLGLLVVAAGCAGSSGEAVAVDASETSEAPIEAAADTSEAAVENALFVGEFETLQGSQIDFASLEGQDTVLWFWAPW